MKPVSYTHLDVYKRQYMHLPSRSESKTAAQLHESYLLHGLYADADGYAVCATFLSTITGIPSSLSATLHSF